MSSCYASHTKFRTGSAIPPDYTSDVRSWKIGVERAPQSRLHADPTNPKPFPYPQSPIGALLSLYHLSVRDGMWDARQYDPVSNALLTNHNVWVYLDAMARANDLVVAQDQQHVPPLLLRAVDLIDQAFLAGDWSKFVQQHAPDLDAMAPNEYV